MKSAPTQKPRPQGVIIGIAAVISIVLYLAGVASGLFANRLLEQRTNENIKFLKEYVETMHDTLNDLQLERAFLESLQQEERCRFTAISMQDLVAQLTVYWEAFPVRIEAYEQNKELSMDYLALKDEYTRLSLRAWTLARNDNLNCHGGIVPVLYFYSPGCAVCIQQGEHLDAFKAALAAQNQTVIAFTIDINSAESLVVTILRYYDISRSPALVIGDRALEGRVYSAQELLEVFEEFIQQGQANE